METSPLPATTTVMVMDGDEDTMGPDKEVIIKRGDMDAGQLAIIHTERTNNGAGNMRINLQRLWSRICGPSPKWHCRRSNRDQTEHEPFKPRQKDQMTRSV